MKEAILGGYIYPWRGGEGGDFHTKVIGMLVISHLGCLGWRVFVSK